MNVRLDGDAVDNLRQLLANTRHTKRYVRALFDRFDLGVGEVNRLAREVDPRAERIHLLSSDHRAALGDFLSRPPTYALCGPNSSGKSSTLEMLLQLRILPSGDGNVSGRILQIEYATGANSCAFLADPATGVEIVDTRVSLAHLLAIERRADLQSTIARFIKRPEDGDNVRDNFATWSSRMVVLRLPNKLLETGVVLVDTPGFNDGDSPTIQAALTAYIARHRPTVLFCYSNPSFGDAETTAFERLMRAYSGDAARGDHNSDTRLVPEVFFVSTHADVATHSEAPYHWNDTEGDFERARRRLVAERLRWLRDALAASEHRGLLRDDGSNMCVVSPRDVHQVLYKPDFVVPIIKACTLTMFHAFVDALVAWLDRAEERRLVDVLDRIDTAVQRFFVAATDRITTGASLTARKQCLAVLRQRMLERVGEALLTFKEQFHRKLQDPAVFDAIVAAATNTALPDLDNKVIDSDTREAVRKRMCEEVYKALNIVVNREFATLLDNAVRETDRDVDTVLYAGDIDRATRTLYSLILRRVSFQRASGFGDLLASVFAWTIAVALSPLVLVYALVELVFKGFERVDRTLKQEAAHEALRHCRDRIGDIPANEFCPQSVKEQVDAIVNKIFDDLDEAVDEHARLLAVDGVRQLSPEFALVLAMTLAVRSQIERGARGAFVPVSLGESGALGAGAFGTVRPVQGEPSLAMKRVSMHTRSGQLCKKPVVEVQLLHLLTVRAAERAGDEPLHVLTLRGVQFCRNGVERALPDSVDTLLAADTLHLEIVVDRYDCSLLDWLRANLNTMSERTAVDIMLQVARGVEFVHSLGITHRDIKIENVLVHRGGEAAGAPHVVLGDFGIGTVLPPTTNIGDVCFRAPEMLLAPENRAPLTSQRDIYTLGVLFYETVPKRAFVRCTPFVHLFAGLYTPQRLPDLPPTTLAPLRTLIDDCLRAAPTDRPTAAQVVRRLAELLDDCSTDPLNERQTECVVCLDRAPTANLGCSCGEIVCGTCAAMLVARGVRCPVCRRSLHNGDIEVDNNAELVAARPGDAYAGRSLSARSALAALDGDAEQGKVEEDEVEEGDDEQGKVDEDDDEQGKVEEGDGEVAQSRKRSRMSAGDDDDGDACAHEA